MQRCARVYRLPMNAPDDVSAIRELITDSTLEPQQIVAILGKTEGNGCVNDFTRGYATLSLRNLLAEFLNKLQIEQIPLVMSGGTEGGLSPHWIVLAIVEEVEQSGSALAIGSVITRVLEPSEVGRHTQSLLVQDAVIQAMKAADIKTADDVHFVQIKCPLLTSERIASVDGDVSTSSTLKSMGLSRGASALGVALALKEIDCMSEADIGVDLSKWSSRASCSAGIELMSCEVLVMGQSSSWSGPLRIAHTVMEDAIDAQSVIKLLSQSIPDDPWPVSPGRLIATLAKAEASSSGRIRECRHTMLEDSDVSSTRHARGFVGGLISGLIGHTENFISGGAEHQGPDGGGPIAVIYSQPTGS